MTDPLTPGQTAYSAYGRTTNFLNYQGLPMPAWDQLGDTIRQAWENAATAVAQPSGEAVRGVQGWLALDLHTALGKPIDHTAEHQGHDSWADWWAQLCAEVRALANKQPGAAGMRLGWNDCDPVAICHCGARCVGDSVNDAVLAWTRHLTTVHKGEV
jgi:hypothetical protein